MEIEGDTQGSLEVQGILPRSDSMLKCKEGIKVNHVTSQVTMS